MALLCLMLHLPLPSLTLCCPIPLLTPLLCSGFNPKPCTSPSVTLLPYSPAHPALWWGWAPYPEFLSFLDVVLLRSLAHPAWAWGLNPHLPFMLFCPVLPLIP